MPQLSRFPIQFATQPVTIMKTTKKLLAAGITALLCSSIGSAQIIYSNNFSLGGTKNITNTPPTMANNYAGGTNTAVWVDALGTNDTGAIAGKRPRKYNGGANQLAFAIYAADQSYLPFDGYCELHR